jgi:NADPH:quinone reductase-like Zn-dependent oxidoreductase
MGAMPDAPKPPFTPGFDVVGVVDALGPGVVAPAVGTRVVALLNGGGGYTETLRLPANRLVRLPDGVKPVDAAAAAVNYFATNQMLHRVARLTAGQRILVHGAAGSVGSALLDLAHHAGPEAYGTASRPKHALVTSLGGIPIDYRREDVVARVRGEGGVDAAFDAIGGQSFLRSHSSLRPAGASWPTGYRAPRTAAAAASPSRASWP